jgi:hypothetical protein
VGDEYGAVAVTAAADDVALGAIRTTRGATLSGRVVFEGQRPESSDPMRIMTLEGRPDAPLPFVWGGGPAIVRPDGTFELKGLGGVRMLRLMNAPAGWIVRSVRLDGVDVTDTGIEFRGTETVNGLEVILSRKLTEISGGVTVSARKPTSDYTVIVFAEDPAKWRVPSRRWVAGVRAGRDGRFRVRGLPPGAYLAVALSDIADGQWMNPEVLERLRPRAERFSLDEGQSRTLELKLRDGGEASRE